MTVQTFGQATILDPPVLIDGTLYGLAVKFTSPSSVQNRTAIVSGIVERVETVSGTIKRVVCQRGVQKSSYTKAYGAGDSVEIVYSCLTGGNICDTPEPARVLSHANDMACRGSLAGIRAIVGDLFQTTIGTKTIGCLVTGVTAYGVAPDSVSYNGGDTSPIRAERVLDGMYSLAVAGEGAGAYILEDVGLFTGCGVVWTNSGAATSGFATKRTFNSDAYNYPDDAEFGGSVPEYWIAPGGGGVRLSSQWAAVGADGAQLRYWSQGVATTGSATVYGLLLDSPVDATGFATATDSVVMAGKAQTADFSTTVTVSEGPGFVAWRSSAEANAATLQVSFDASGTTDAGGRASNGASYSSASPSHAGFSLPCLFKIAKSGTGVTISVASTAAPTTWFSVASVTVSADHDEDSGITGVGILSGDGVKWTGQSSGDLMEIGGATGRMSVQRIVTSDFVVSQAVSVDSALTLDYIVNETTGQTMTQNNSILARDVYAVSGSTVVFRAESAGDSVTLIYEETSIAPTGAGRPPRTFNQTNFATFDGTGEAATTNTAENVANWFDAILIDDENGELDGVTTGQEFSIYRDPVFLRSDPPTIEINWKNGAADWVEVSSAAIYAQWAQGWVLVTKAWLDSYADQSFPCVRATGKTFRQLGIDAASFTWGALGVEALDQLFVSGGTASAEVASSSGEASVGMGPTNWVCCGGSTPIPSGAIYGTLNNSLEDFADSIGWYLVSSELNYYDSVGQTSFTAAELAEVVTDCNTPPATDPLKIKKVGDQYTTEQMFLIRPYSGQSISGPPSSLLPWWDKENYYFSGPTLMGDAVPDADSYFWTFPNLLITTDIPRGGYSSAFSFQGIGFAPASWFRYLPDGAEILEAYMRVKFEGMRSRTWTMEFSSDGTETAYSYTDQGVLVREFDTADSTDWFITDDGTLPPEPTHGGSVGFSLIGEALNTSRVQLVDGAFYPSPNSEFASIGSIPTTTITNGIWKLIDVTGAMQAVLNDRNSRRTNYFLWPNTGTGDPGESVQSLASYVLGLAPSWEANVTYGAGCNFGYSHSATGQVTWFSSLTAGNVLVRYRVSGVEGLQWVPTVEPKSTL